MKILYVQKQGSYAQGYASKLSKEDIEVIWTATGQEAVRVLDQRKDITVILADPDVEDMDRESFFQSLRAHSRPDARLILSAMTGANPITPQTREKYNIEKIFTWDHTAWAYVFNKSINGQRAEFFAV